MIHFLICLSFSFNFNDSCDIYTAGNCSECVSHFKDRQCGWCSTSNKCVQYNSTDCPLDKLYYNNNAKCGEEIPPPSPTPWPHYEANPTFCYNLSDQYCEMCVSKDPTMSCGWCHTTKECIMGDADGPFFLECKEWSFTTDSKCTGKISNKAILGVRVGIGIFIAIVSTLCIIGCYKVIKSPQDANPTYEVIKNTQ